MQEQGMMAAGQPGLASPNAVGADMNAQQGMANQAGVFPPMEMPPPAGGPQPPGGGAPPAQDPMAGTQSLLGTPQQGAQTDVMMVAQQVVSWLNQLPDNEKQQNLVQMQQSNPQLYSLVLPMLQSTAGADMNSASMPQPMQRPARRGPEAAQI